MDTNWKTEHFTSKEFDSPDEKKSGRHMQQSFIDKLEVARVFAGIPFYISSGFRTISHNSEVGGVNSSAHVRGYACDIRILSSHQRFIIVEALLASGFSRIGITNAFIHVDLDGSKPQNVIWTY